MLARDALGRARRALLAAGVRDYDADSAWLLCHVIGCGRSELLLGYDRELDTSELTAYEELIGRRAQREPLQRITGEAYFMGLRFLTHKNVLIPRMDTETLCQAALELAMIRGYNTALDLCTGSGALAVCLTKLGGLRVTAADISQKCVEAALENAELHGVEIEVVLGDMLEPLDGRRFDMIVCNPPYVSAGYPLEPEVALHDPPLALFAGEDGMDFYRRLAAEARPHTNESGALLMEVGYAQAMGVCSLFIGRPVIVTKDLSGIDRVVRVDF